MNVSVYLLDAALSGDELAQNQISDILKENRLAGYPKLDFNWKHKDNVSESDKYGIFVAKFNNKKWFVDDYESVLSEAINSREEAILWAENYIKSNIEKQFIREI
jgi:hypothetical protein